MLEVQSAFTICEGVRARDVLELLLGMRVAWRQVQQVLRLLEVGREVHRRLGRAAESVLELLHRLQSPRLHLFPVQGENDRRQLEES